MQYKKWKYRTVELSDDVDDHGSQLSELGADGWEVVSVVRSCSGGTTAYLKKVYWSD